MIEYLLCWYVLKISDADSVLQKSHKVMKRQIPLKVERYTPPKPSTSILVQNLTSKTCDCEYLHLYFSRFDESLKEDDIQADEEKMEAVITFKDVLGIVIYLSLFLSHFYQFISPSSFASLSLLPHSSPFFFFFSLTCQPFFFSFKRK